MLKLIFAIIATLLLTACISVTDKWPVVYIKHSNSTYIHFGDTPEGKIGRATRYPNGTSDIIVHNGLYRDKLRIIIIHELMHVLGYSGHLQNDSECWFYHTPMPPKMEFCSKDIELIRKVKLERPIIVECEKGLDVHVQYAITRLNSVAGKEIFTFKGIR